ncbi:MAG: hypothetical protein COV69_03385 [Parcubacteria group bacterium CG11_big_fil_rev_8_21_14_0_20_39_14]|nr:MAG: hypothetical protein COV69_03385 [Parcubacteria group bacterium CG11_big_fil_rev_8_21_14_0_20_39_14]
MKRKYAAHLLKKTKEDFDKIAKDFSDSRYSAWGEFNIFKDYIKDGDRILDLGCGNGRLIELFKTQDIEYVGVDNSEKLIEIARDKFSIFNGSATLTTPRSSAEAHSKPLPKGFQFSIKPKFMVADALNLPFRDNYFDKIFSVAVLHYIPSGEYRKRFLKEAKRVLKPEGILILTVWSLWRRPKTLKLIFKYSLLKIIGRTELDFKDIFVPWQNKISRYVHCFTKKELKNLTEESGFKIEKTGILRRGETLKDNRWFPTGRAKNYNIYLVAKKT